MIIKKVLDTESNHMIHISSINGVYVSSFHYNHNDNRIGKYCDSEELKDFRSHRRMKERGISNQIYRHKKGNIYLVLKDVFDLDHYIWKVWYVDIMTGKHYAQPYEMFHDGRFTLIE